MIIYSYSLVKTAFVSLLLMISSVTIDATCSASVSKLFNSIVGITSANEGEHSAASNSNQRPLELKLADAQMLQQWIGQIARKIVVEDGIFAGIYSCGPKINIDAVILTDGLPEERIKKIDKNSLKKVQNSEEKSQFLKLLFSFGAMLSAEIGEQSQQNGTLRALLKAYECVGGKFAEEKDLAGSAEIKSDGISDFAIGAVIKSPIEQLKVDKIILEMNNRRHIQELTFLNALNIQMTPKDVINFAYFIYNKFLSNRTNLFSKRFLEENVLSVSNLGEDPAKSRRIAYQLLLHLKHWGLKELKEISSKKSFENVIELTRRDKCFIGIFTRNLLQKMAKFELLEDYFGELNISELVARTENYLRFYEEFSAENCNEKSRKELERKQLKQKNKPKKENDGIENSKIYPFIDEAIRIDWNIWKEIIKQIDELSETIKSRQTNEDLKEFLEYVNKGEEGTTKIIMAKFDENEFGLKLKAEVKKMLELGDETTPKNKIKHFCLNLAKIRQICVENIEQFERQIPFKINVRIKQKENHNKFYDFIAIFVKHFGRNSIKNDNEESIEFGLNGAKSFLKKVYISAKELLQNKNLNFETAIKAILGENLNEKAKNLLKEFYVPPKNAEKEGGLKHFLEVNVKAQLFELFFSFAARLEAIVHGKNIDGTIEESRENSKDKIRAFLAVPNCFNVPEWANKFSIFDYWMEIKEINSKESQKMPGIGVAIYKKAMSSSQRNYKTLKSLNEQKFSFYESTKLLRKIYDKIEKNHCTSDGLKIPTIFKDIVAEVDDKWPEESNSQYRKYIRGCAFAKLFQNISANFMKMKGIDVKLHMDKLDSDIQDYVKRDFGKYCKEIKGIDRKVDLNNACYDLVLNFEFNAWKDVRDRTEDLLAAWAIFKADEKRALAEGNEQYMTQQIFNLFYFTSDKTNRQLISKIEALKAKENDGFYLMELFDKAHNLARKIIKEEMPNLEKAKEELKRLEQSESDENYKKEKLFDEIENFKRKIQDKEKEAINLKNKILLQKEENKMPKKQRENAATFLTWLKSNGTEEMTKETKQILQKISTLSELNQKVNELYLNNIKKPIRNLTTDDERERLKKLQKQMDLVEEKLEVHLEKVNEFKNYGGNNLLELAKLIGDNLNKTQMTKKMDIFEYKKMGKELAQQTDILLTNEFEQKLDAILTVCKDEELVEWYKNELNRVEAILKKLMKEVGEMNEEIAKIDRKLSEILMEKEVNTWVNKSKVAREMGKSLGQMLENVMKHYGQKIDKQKKAGKRMELLR